MLRKTGHDANTPLCPLWFPVTSGHLNYEQRGGLSPGQTMQSLRKSKSHRSRGSKVLTTIQNFIPDSNDS